MREISSSCFHRKFTAFGSIDACMRAIMLSPLLTKSAVLPKMDSIILIAHMNPSWPPSSTQ